VREAVTAGACVERSCAIANVSSRTYERWRADPDSEDERQGPNGRPPNALTDKERAEVLRLANRPEHRDLSPKQIVPKLADAGTYVASESTFYRLLRAAGQLAHRGKARAPVARPLDTHEADGPSRVWSWDITYLRTNIRGTFLYLYLMLDVWSRKIVGFCIEPTECADRAALLLRETCAADNIDSQHLVLHSDNGGPMRGATMLATMEKLGVVPSFSRPRVSDDNPYSEALFRTLKYMPEFPSAPFETIDAARAWVARFVHWYNFVHRHSAIRFVSPDDRHQGRDAEILRRRKATYEAARRKNPTRWTGETRNCNPIGTVTLNPAKTSTEEAKLVS